MGSLFGYYFAPDSFVRTDNYKRGITLKRAILYARVSGDDRKNATSSIEGQLGKCRKYAAQRGYRVVSEVFEEPDKPTSGADWLPELEKLIRLTPSSTFDVLIRREVDRLARNRFKQLATEIELENHGVVALAWLLHRPGVTAPIIGASKPAHLEDAIAALSIDLSAEDISYLEEPYQPHPVLGHN